MNPKTTEIDCDKMKIFICNAVKDRVTESVVTTLSIVTVSNNKNFIYFNLNEIDV